MSLRTVSVLALPVVAAFCVSAKGDPKDPKSITILPSNSIRLDYPQYRGEGAKHEGSDNEIMTMLRESPVVKKFNVGESRDRIARLFLIERNNSPLSALTKRLQKSIIEELAKNYQEVESINVDIDRYFPRYDKAIYLARTSLYLEEQKVDYFFLIADEWIEQQLTPKLLADLDYIDKRARALVFLSFRGNAEVKDLTTQLKVFEGSFQNLATFGHADWFCEAALTK